MTTEAIKHLSEPRLERVLVVLSPDLGTADALTESTLVTRALALARATGCELEFFHVCHDNTLTPSIFFAGSDELQKAQKETLDKDATLLAEMVVRLDTRGLSIKHDARWDAPRTDAILRKIDEAQPDLVMKQSREYGYVFGLFNNTDWDLVRRSPAHLWFVTEDGSDEIQRIVTAIGSNDDADDMISAVDYDVFRVARTIAEKLGASNYPVHAYQLPKGLSYAAYAPEIGGAYPIAAPESHEQTRRRIAQKHGRSIQAFAESFQIDPDQVRLGEGDPSYVIPKAAETLEADLIVMAARNLSRWERLTQSVTAEPVLADAPCDVVFVKDAREASIPQKAAEQPKQGSPAFDLEQAVMDPARTFGSPHKLVEATAISPSMRKRLLQIWEQDIRAQMTEEDEGGPVQPSKADLLDAIISAKEKLLSIHERDATESDEPTH